MGLRANWSRSRQVSTRGRQVRTGLDRVWTEGGALQRETEREKEVNLSGWLGFVWKDLAGVGSETNTRSKLPPRWQALGGQV